MKKISREDFIRSAIMVHGVKYDYTLSDYKNTKSKVDIVCPEHGLFSQVAGRHIHQGSGCNKCGHKSAAEARTLAWEERLKEFRRVHGEKYSYDESSYKKRKSKMKIICPEHGPFMQSSCSHQRGNGCPSCSPRGGYRPHEDGFVYIIESSDKAFVKIGIANDVTARIKFLKWTTPFDIKLRSFFFKAGEDAPILERRSMKNLMSAGFRGFNGATEWFRHDEEEIKKIEDMLS